jgi:hypothetical protein
MLQCAIINLPLINILIEALCMKLQQAEHIDFKELLLIKLNQTKNSLSMI